MKASNPFLIEGPALISFSGGRTSAMMVRRILDAHGGALPADVYAVFCNTGKEREETLRFVHECESRWGIRVHWLEWRSRLKGVAAQDRFEVVGFNSAARRGEPFAALIRDKGAVPNVQARWCTAHLKFQICCDFMEVMGHARWLNVLGLRHDEQLRILRKVAENVEQDNPWRHLMPLDSAGIRRPDVMQFWSEQPFDLGLQPWEGNCTKCFLKGRKILEWEVRNNPGDNRWWLDAERHAGGTFSKRFSMAELIKSVASQPLMDLVADEDLEFDGECGASCDWEVDDDPSRPLDSTPVSAEQPSRLTTGKG